MWVIARQSNDSVVIVVPPGVPIPAQGLEITVTVLGPRKGRTRLGIEAPSWIKFERDDYIPDEKDSV